MNKTPFEALDLNIAHIPPFLRGLKLFLISDWGSFANLKIKEVKKAARVANGSVLKNTVDDHKWLQNAM